MSHFCSAKAIGKTQNLPQLPVPKLHDTLNKYLKSVKPHLNEDEFATTSRLVKDFGGESGVGKKLQVSYFQT